MDGQFVELAADTRVKLDKKKFHTIEAVVDRLVIDEKIRVRLGDSVETALRWGEGVMFTLHQMPEKSAVSSQMSAAKANGGAQATARPTNDEWIETLHSNKMCSPATGKSYDPADAEAFFVQHAGGRMPGLPRSRPKDDL